MHKYCCLLRRVTKEENTVAFLSIPDSECAFEKKLLIFQRIEQCYKVSKRKLQIISVYKNFLRNANIVQLEWYLLFVTLAFVFTILELEEDLQPLVYGFV